MRLPALLCCALLLGAAQAAPLPEPALRLATTIESARLHQAPPHTERELLRLEWKATQSREEEADAVGSLLARVNRMEGIVADLGRLIAAWPAARPAADSLPAVSTSAEPPTEQWFGLPLRGLLIGATVLLFVGWLLARRHHFRRQQRLKANAFAADEPPTTLLPDEPPPRRRPATEVASEVDFALDSHPMPKPSSAVPAEAVAAAEVATELAPIVAPLGALDFELIDDLDHAPADASETPADAGNAPVAALDASPAAASADEESAEDAFTGANPDQAIELADIMISMGLTHGAAQALSEQIRQHPKQALYHWLKLLEIYRHSDMQDDFERAAQELRQYFNVQAQDWHADDSDASLEDFPRLAAKLQELWPTAECAEFLVSLLEDNRGGTRNGFPQSVAEEILLLQRVLGAETLRVA